MKEAALSKLRLVCVQDELPIGKIGLPCCPESTDIAIVVLDLIKELKGLIIVCLLGEGQKLKTTQVTIGLTSHILVEPNTLFPSDFPASLCQSDS